MKKVKSCVLLSFLAAVSASAFTLEGGMPGTLFAPSAQTLGHLDLVVSASAYGHQDASMIRDRLFLLDTPANLVTLDSAEIQDLQSASFRLNLAMGLGEHFDFGLSFPIHLDFISDTQAKGLSGGGPGDPVLSAKGGLALAGDHVFDAALLATLSVPSGNDNGFLPKQAGYMPRDSVPSGKRFFSSHAAGGSARLLLTLDLTRLENLPLPFRSSLGAGASYSGIKGTEGRMLLGGGLEWLAMPRLGFFLNAQSETPFSKAGDAGNVGKDMSFLSAGFSAIGDDGVFFSVSIEKSLPSYRPFRPYQVPADDGIFTYSARYQPRFALAANLGWNGALVASDDDKDDIPDRQDICPRAKEDVDGFQDMDGCPETDNDADSIPDKTDKCPMQQEDQDGFEDGDGCPESDNDKDGLADALDKCLNEPEDTDGFEDYDGCPELDNDRDGVPDPQDRCAGITEDRDKFEDEDGCPEPDNDQDKIPDLNDKCPNEPETYNDFEDGDGCADMSRSMLDAAPLENRLLLKQVRFQGTTSELQAGSYASLDTLADRIRAIPNAMIEILGYWDNSDVEPEAVRNSEARAQAVRKYLVSRGVPSSQILARGLGSRNPIGNNKTAAGRFQNRRIELHRLN